jgi:hypothetical protein
MHAMVSYNCPVSDEAMVRSGLRLKVDSRVAHILSDKNGSEKKYTRLISIN